VAIKPLQRAAFTFSGLEDMSAFLRGLRLHERESLAESAKAHFGSNTVTVTLRTESNGEEVRALSEKLGGRELCK
jgi:hypothetical protein